MISVDERAEGRRLRAKPMEAKLVRLDPSRRLRAHVTQKVKGDALKPAERLQLLLGLLKQRVRPFKAHCAARSRECNESNNLHELIEVDKAAIDEKLRARLHRLQPLKLLRAQMIELGDRIEVSKVFGLDRDARDVPIRAREADGRERRHRRHQIVKLHRLHLRLLALDIIGRAHKDLYDELKDRRRAGDRNWYELLTAKREIDLLDLDGMLADGGTVGGRGR